MLPMKSIRSISKHWPDLTFFFLVLVFGYLYFVEYLTPGKIIWYKALFEGWWVVLKGLLSLL